jgi:hypothetical protein
MKPSRMQIELQIAVLKKNEHMGSPNKSKELPFTM